MWPVIAVTDSLTFPTYLVVNSLAFSLCVIWIHRRAAKHKMNQNAVLDLALAAMIGGFIGARLTHVLLEHPRFYFDHPDFIFKFWYGGFVFYGGALGALITSKLVCKRRKLNFLIFADLFAPVLAFGYAVGRLGCLAAGCCFGKPTTLPWAVHFPGGVEAPQGIGLHPTQVYSSLWSFISMLALLLAEKKGTRRKSGEIFGLWLLLHGLGRGLVEQFRDDFRGQTFLNLSISTWISVAALCWGFWLLIRQKVEAANASVTS